jgi:hypothetical protein
MGTRPWANAEAEQAEEGEKATISGQSGIDDRSFQRLRCVLCPYSASLERRLHKWENIGQLRPGTAPLSGVCAHTAGESRID